MGPRGKTIGCCALVLCLSTGCGSASSADAQATAGRFAASGGVCDLLAPQALEELVANEGKPCEQSLPELNIPREPVTSVAVWGGEAQARSGADVLFLHQFPQGWRVTGAGCRPRGQDRPYLCEVGGS